MLEPVVALINQWKHLYSDSARLAAAVGFVHLGGLLLGGGSAVAADLGTLRLAGASSRRRMTHIAELAPVHRAVLAGLGLTFVSGLLLTAADLSTFVRSPLFWAKMGLLAVLLVNGASLARTETALRNGGVAEALGWLRLRRAAIVSLVLWFVLVLLGTLITAA